MKKKLINNLQTTIFYIITFLCTFAISWQYNIADYDLWARLLQGKAFWQLGHILKQDPFSYTPTHNWYDHEWGSSVVFYFFYDKFGPSGLLMLKTIIIFLTIFFIIQSIKLLKPKYTSSPYNFLFFFFLLQTGLNSLFITIRCHIFTFLFFSIFLFLLLYAKEKNTAKPLMLIPLLTIFWSNIHGGSVSGLGLIAMFFFGELLNKRPCKKYLITLIVSCLAFLINPYGIDYILFLLKATLMNRKYIAEWQNSFSYFNTSSENLLFKFWFISSLILLFYQISKKQFIFKNLDKTKIIILLATAYLSFKTIKHQPFLLIASSVFLYDCFYEIFNRLIIFIREKLFLTSKHFIKLFLIIKNTGIYLMIIYLAVLNYKLLSPYPNLLNYNFKSVEFIKLNKIKGNVVTLFHLGSYTMYKLYPNNLVYMDGRYEEVYPDVITEDMASLYGGVENNRKWDNVFELYKTDIILMPKESFGYQKLKEDNRFIEVYDEGKASVWLRKNLVKGNYKMPPVDYKYYRNTCYDNDIDFKELSKKINLK